ncbi:MAG: beta-N-acetylglucosaminidase domain-containing protein [Corallococcus sp.]|nr:beta-N-acetylglucosaminidase domain-containing protein [Corallococcus sp.]MCM1359580.1 beta-N-acetylglucosaminidase domain-containing protein [Corallococcus sp.]MCM1395172.1 beta-N-acetylglucosaminidase domain-containing protein [Corallococcus sp.]
MKKSILVLAVICLASIIAAVPLGAAHADAGVEYEIYPIPHSVRYESGNLQVGDTVSVSIGSAIDQPTVNRLYDALSQMDVIVADGAQTKVYLGVYGSGDAADNFAHSLSFVGGLFDKNDAYLLAVTSNAIVVLGKDTDAAFYGVTTLKAILSQSGKTVRRLQIEDWADGKYRGFIEGYYGIPWTTDERVELMRFGSNFKTNVYIYAPKDDPYHSSNWRGLYSATDLAELKEQIATGVETKTRFVWAIHPFMEGNPFTRANYQKDLNTLLAKFDQLYQAGVRQFALSADDMPNNAIDPVLQKDLCNDITAWINSKGDVKNLVFVPTVYWLAKPDESDNYDGNEDYFDQLIGSGETALDESVEIMWTGNKVCSTTNNGKFQEFTTLTDGRKPFMWMNWPVNDYTYSTRDLESIKPYLLLGKGEVFNTKLAEGQEAAFSGIVVNPLQEAEASKISIFACADYTWNVNGFDADKSWQASFKYIEDTATDDLYEVCKHLVGVGSRFGEENRLEESVELKQIIDRYNEALENGGSEALRTEQLIAAFEDISRSARSYLDNAQNQKLKANIGPFVQALGLRCEAAAKYLQIRRDMGLMTDNQLAVAVDEAESVLSQSKSCKTVVQYLANYNKIYVDAYVAPEVIAPFVEKLAAEVKDEAYLKLGKNTGVVYGGFNGIRQGKIENAFDGDENTFVWFDGRPADGAYVRIDFGETMALTSLRVLSGTLIEGEETGCNDKWKGYAEYSSDGKNFEYLGDVNGLEVTLDLRDNPVSARFVKLVVQGAETWTALREVILNVLDENEPSVTFGGFTHVSGSSADVLDGNEDTCIFFDWKCDVGAYLTIDLRKSVHIENIYLLLSSIDDNNIHDASETKLSYSSDGVTWTDIDASLEGSQITVDGLDVNARYVKLTAQVSMAHGLKIYEFGVNKA